MSLKNTPPLNIIRPVLMCQLNHLAHNTKPYNHKLKSHSGFTLVELSIVLVIIGLLIGGILVAQSMIGTSRIVAVAAQIQQFDAGVESFKAKYNALPGDAQQFGGNGDGLVTITSTGGLM